MDWSYYTDSKISNCFKFSFFTSCFFIGIKFASKNYFESISKNQILSIPQKFFVKHYFLLNSIYELNWMTNPSIVRNVNLRIAFIITTTLFVNMILKELIVNDQKQSILRNVSSNGLTGFSLGYLITGQPNIMFYSFIIGCLGGLIYSLELKRQYNKLNELY